MRYQLPALDVLKQIAEELEQHYKGSNSQRLNFIKLMEGLTKLTATQTDEEAAKILLGAAIFELEHIEAQYKMTSPVIQNGWVYNSGSQVYTDLITKLNVTETNVLNDDERLIYLFKFYQFIEKHLANDDDISLMWISKSRLLDEISAALKQIKKREYDRIELFSQGTPKLAALQKNISMLAAEYQLAASSRWFSNSKRQTLLLFIEFINQTCNDLYGLAPHSLSNETETNKAKDMIYLQSFNARMGLIVYVLNEIYNEYIVRSPRNSVLFKQCLDTINLKHLNDIDQDKKITWLRALSNHIANVKNMSAYYEKLQQDWKQKGLKKLDDFQHKIDVQLAKQESLKRQPSRTKTCLTTITSYATQYSLGFVATKFAARLAIPFIPVVGGLVATAIAGPVGMVVYGTAGTLIATQLGRLVQEKLVPEAVASLYEKVLERIGKVIGVSAVGVAITTFSVTSKGLKQLMGYYKEKTNDTFLEEWIDTLLALPDDVMSPAEKNQIKHMLGDEEVLEAEKSLTA